MDFELSREQVMIRDMAREFAKREIAPLVKEDDRDERYRPELVRKMATLGLLGGPVPQEYGGLGVDHVCHGLVCEEVGAVSAAVFAATLLAHVSLFELPLLEWADKSMRDAYLPRAARGELLACCALPESDAGGDWVTEITAARKDEDLWTLSGTSQSWVTNAGIADLALVFAQTGETGGKSAVSAFVVDKGIPGLGSRPVSGKAGLRASNVAQVVLDNSPVPAKNLLGKVGDGLEVAAYCTDRAYHALGAAALGVAQACADAGAGYARERRQFGRPIARFHLIQEMIADTVIETEAARFLVYRLGLLMNRKHRSNREAAIVKAYATGTALRAASRAIQIHGAYGVSVDYPLERYYRDAMALDVLAGTPQNAKLAVARQTLEL